MIKEKESPVRDVAIAKIKPALSLFPLPVNNELNIDIDETIETVEIFNMQGQLVVSAAGLSKINTQPLTSGSFIVRIKTDLKEYTKQISCVK